LRSVCLGFWIPAGSRDESGGLAGATHFIEHLLFKGSRSHSAEEIAQIFDTMGGELNAATSREYVVLYARFLDEHLPRAMDVVVDMLLNPTFADLDREREVVLEEIAMYEDSPQDMVHDYFAQAVFGSHPLGLPVLGTRESIAGVADADVRAYYDRYFRFSDMVVAAAGSVDHDQLRALLLERQSTCANGVGAHTHSAPEIRPRRLFVSKETEQMHVCLGGQGLARDDERRYASWVMDSLFGGSLSSRLFQEVREKRGLVYSIYTFSNMYAETGLCGIYFGCRPDRVGQVMEIVRVEIEKLRNEPVSEEELTRAREHLKGRVILGLESTSSRMTRLGKAVATGIEILTLDEMAARIDAVTAEQVQELAWMLYQPERLAVAGIGADEDVFTAAVPAAPAAGGVTSVE
jgi:predicted Zn-dependent peptidase